jgi:ubiquinone/menaquinone biosynthesis C-methylase UbiE
LIEEKEEKTDLRIGDHLLDLYELRNERKYYGSYLRSDVEYAARLHSINFTDFNAELLAPYTADSYILDLGCGQLPYINSFSRNKVKEFYGVDLSFESLKIAKRHFKGTFPLTLVRHGIRNIPFRDASVDIVVSSEVLEHLDHPKDYLREIYRVMKKGGYLSLSTPCASMYLYPHNLLCMGKNPLDWYKKLNCHNYWKEALNWHPGLRPNILKKWVKDAGFSIVRHDTRLWYYYTPVRLISRLLSLVERMGIFSSGNIFSKYLKYTDILLASNIPIIKWFGIRQFVLCQKKL